MPTPKQPILEGISRFLIKMKIFQKNWLCLTFTLKTPILWKLNELFLENWLLTHQLIESDPIIKFLSLFVKLRCKLRCLGALVLIFLDYLIKLTNFALVEKSWYLNNLESYIGYQTGLKINSCCQKKGVRPWSTMYKQHYLL